MNVSEIKDFILSRYDLTSHVSHSCVLCWAKNADEGFREVNHQIHFF